VERTCKKFKEAQTKKNEPNVALETKVSAFISSRLERGDTSGAAENFETRDVPWARRSTLKGTSRVSKFSLSTSWSCGRVQRIHGIASNVCRTLQCSASRCARNSTPPAPRRRSWWSDVPAPSRSRHSPTRRWTSTKSTTAARLMSRPSSCDRSWTKVGRARRGRPAGRSDRAIARAINSRQSCHDVRLASCKNVEAHQQMHAALWRVPLHCPSLWGEDARKAQVRAYILRDRSRFQGQRTSEFASSFRALRNKDPAAYSAFSDKP